MTDNIVSFMDFMNKAYPEYAKEIQNNRKDLGLRDKRPNISEGAFKLIIYCIIAHCDIC